MVFSSIFFLFLFLPIVLSIYYLMRLPWLFKNQIFKNRISNIWLLLASILFYCWGEGLYIFVIFFSSSVDYLAGLIMAGAFKTKGPVATLQHGTHRTKTQKLALVLSLSCNLGLLAFFKYYNFGIENVSAALSFLGIHSQLLDSVTSIALPLGISFYTFQSMSYTIDVYRGDATATKNYADFICFVTLFPPLIAGPIVRYRQVEHELVYRKINLETIALGIMRFSFGLAKKVLIANKVGEVADKVFAIPDNELTFGLSWLGIISYSLQIYFDFSGYSDMAIGLGHMLGFKFLENFNYPYISKSIKEFWRRWHISLSSWLRDYLYIPLGGSRVSHGRHIFNLWVVFFLCGLWHGASWNFVIWGLFHGSFMVLEGMRFGKWLKVWPPIFQHIYTLLVVVISWVLFRAITLQQTWAFLKAMVGAGLGTGQQYYVDFYLLPDVTLAIILGIIFSTPIFPYLKRWGETFIAKRSDTSQPILIMAWNLARYTTMIFLLFMSSAYLSSGTHNPFIYFRF